MKSVFLPHYTTAGLLRMTFPSMVMLVFTSIYGVVDGFFVSNFAGKTGFTAVNFIMPVLMILGSLGFMFGTGGGALIAKSMGEGDSARADRLFSMVVWVSAAGAMVLAVLGVTLLPALAAALGAEGEMLSLCVRYGRIILVALPAYVLQFEFQCLFATAGKPKLGLYVTVAAGLTNILLDALFVGVRGWGVEGAAAATALSQCVGGVLPLVYFARPNSSALRLGPPSMDARALAQVCLNGSSELMSNISMSVVGMLYNLQLLRYAGEDGVAAYGVLMYLGMIFQAIFIGYAVGVAPAISFHYGAQNHTELHSLLKKSLLLVGAAAVGMFAAAWLLAAPLARLFVGYDGTLAEMTVRAFSIFSFSFLFSGFAIFGSSFFTALNNGPVSAAISFLRTMVFQVAAVLLLPLLFELDGIWLSITAAECMAVLVTVFFLRTQQRRYQY